MTPIAEDQTLAEIARHHPESVAKVIRARLNEEGVEGAVGEASILMITLGRETAAGIMKFLLDSEIEVIARAMAERQVVTPTERDSVHHETKARILAGTHLAYGGLDYTSEVLEIAMGPRKARAMIDRSIPEASRHPAFDGSGPESGCPVYQQGASTDDRLDLVAAGS